MNFDHNSSLVKRVTPPDTTEKKKYCDTASSLPHANTCPQFYTSPQDTLLVFVVDNHSKPVKQISNIIFYIDQ